MMEPVRLPTSDLEDEQLALQDQRDLAKQVLDVVGSLLINADNTLREVEDNDLLGAAIYRGCQEIADNIGNLALQLEEQGEEERRALAQACVQDSAIVLNDEGISAYESPGEELATMTEDQVMDILSEARFLLRDVESALRGIEQDEAEEIAGVSLIVARLFLETVQSIYATLTPDDLIAQRGLQPSDRVEQLEDDNEASEKAKNSSSKPRDIQAPDSSRMRALWPPLGPNVASALKWGADEAVKKPLLAAALGLTLWPAAIFTAFVGTPVVLADSLVQHIYESMKEGPVVRSLEHGMAQAYHTGLLTIICGKLAGRQALRVASRQLERHGGPEKIIQDVCSMAVERATHPLETAQMVWGGLTWSFWTIHDNIRNMTEHERTEEVGTLM